MGTKRELLNSALQKEGFATIDEPRALFDQMSLLIHDHDDFRRLLWEVCEPSERQNCYNALAPRLLFKPLPLEDYLVRSREWASHRATAQRPIEVKTAEGAILLDEQVKEMKGTMTLTCRICTREEKFPGKTQVDAVIKAREAGWKYEPETEKELCPKCAALRAEKSVN